LFTVVSFTGALKGANKLKTWHCVSDPAGGNAFGDFEAPSSQAD